ncbi:hypothetical protein HJG60_010128 [Phyllostomus discolor]|uniref:Gelsolin-like domain-containing protein n=1 Tax=Phyllostomus discolor TaxID=89673 RepID=A0A834AXX1_9CHIR|nr:hypothetical protein HJG60_010128 [Phyllostomus discolor]
MTKLSAHVKGSLNITIAGVQIWRTEAMQMVPIPPGTFDCFFDGDCYVVLAIHKTGSSLSYDIHYWISQASSQDEQATAAIYTMQMDDFLRGPTVPHHDIQCNEMRLSEATSRRPCDLGRGHGFQHEVCGNQLQQGQAAASCEGQEEHGT